MSELLGELQSRYKRTGAATTAYNRTVKKLEEQRRTARRANSALEKSRSALTRSRTQAGLLARQQYRDADAALPPALEVLLGGDPRRAMEQKRLLRRAAGDQARTVRRLTSDEHRTTALARKARAALAEERRLAERKKSQRDVVRKQLRGIETRLASLPREQLAELRKLEGASDGAAWPSGTGDDPPATAGDQPSESSASRAVASS